DRPDVIRRAILTPAWSAPRGWTGSGRWFDRLPGVVVLELGGAQVAKRRMEPAGVIDLVDEAGKVGGDVLEGLIGHRIDRLHLECLHETLRLGVVVRVRAPAHGANEAMLGKELAIALGGVLRPAIGVVDAAVGRLAGVDGSLQRCHREAGVDRAADRIPDDPA